MWWYRNFMVINISTAKELELTFYRNIYGDEVKHAKCQSLWRDDDGKFYRVRQLNEFWKTII